MSEFKHFKDFWAKIEHFRDASTSIIFSEFGHHFQKVLILRFFEYAQFCGLFFSALILDQIWIFKDVWQNEFKKNLAESRSVLCRQKKFNLLIICFFFPLFSTMRISIFSDKIELYTAFLFGDENMQNTFRKDAIDR